MLAEQRRHAWRLEHEKRRADGRRRAGERSKAVRRGLRLGGRALWSVPALLLWPFAEVFGRRSRPDSPRAAYRRWVRRLADGQRDLLEREFGAELPRPPEQDGRADLRWLRCAPLLAMTALLPGALVAFGLTGLLAPVLWPGTIDFYGWLLPHGRHAMTGAGEAGLVAATVGGLAMAPGLVRECGRWSVALLFHSENARLEQRVRRLTETRADAVDAQAAELRRIERDLHDGVQARLVAMGLNLGAVEALMERDPAAAKALLAQSRETSETALRELRGLVRGIHPPVLAERGLADAIRALALDCPLKAELTEDLPGRAEAPVESAVYFAVSELLTNAVRHAEADRVWIDLHHTGEALRVQVTDDGRGGAESDSATGTGLRGIERRLGTFDGVIALSSPPGGPTIVTLELPCALSSPRTSTSFEKG